MKVINIEFNNTHSLLEKCVTYIDIKGNPCLFQENTVSLTSNI